MKIFRTNDFSIDTPCVVALGCFDGVHAGHREVLLRAVSIAREHSLVAVAFSFDASPKNFFFPGSAPSITSGGQKAMLIEELGIDILISIPFTEDIASLSPDEFFDGIIRKKLRASHVVCGFNYTFGKRAAGDASLLSEQCAREGIKLCVLDPTLVGGEPVSSSAIRDALLEGDVARAQKFLGRPFSLTSRVEHGNALGRTFGFPTFNQYFHDGTVIPRFGVYASSCTLDGKKYFCITNVGTHPTVSPDRAKAETYILDYSGDLYGKTIRLEFLEFIRPEKKFDSVDALKHAIAIDIEKTKKFFKKS